jgi:hypothetical protein
VSNSQSRTWFLHAKHLRDEERSSERGACAARRDAPVLSIGTPDNVLVAIPGCPSGAVTLPLGFWRVNDIGGRFCLAPSALGRVFGAVDCGATNLTINPGVTGFSSEGEAPCRIDEHPSATVHSPSWGTPAVSFQEISGPIARTRLAAPRPNPFGSSTILEFSLAAASPVRLEIFDVTGRRVLRLLEKNLAAGAHSFSWDGTDGGSPVPEGVYFLRLEAAEFRQTRKLTRLRATP